MDIGVLHSTLRAPGFDGFSSEVVKVDLVPSGKPGEHEIGLYDMFDLLRLLGRRYSLPASLDLNSSDYSDIFQCFEMLKHLAG